MSGNIRIGQRGSKQRVDNINTLLGTRAGVLELVFRLLPLRDLKNVLLVCRLWRQDGEQVLWAGGVLKVTAGNISSVVEALVDRRRLQAVRKISVVMPEEGLRSVDMDWCDLSHPYCPYPYCPQWGQVCWPEQ